MSEIKLELGTLLYKYSSPYVMKYEVIEIRHSKDSILYEIKCLSCNHGEECTLLIGGNTNRLKFIEMTSADDGDDHEYFHTTAGFELGYGYYRLTENEAQYDRQLYVRNFYESRIEKIEENLKFNKSALNHVNELLESLKGEKSE